MSIPCPKAHAVSCFTEDTQAKLIAHGVIFLEGRLPLSHELEREVRRVGIENVVDYLNKRFMHELTRVGCIFKADGLGLLMSMVMPAGSQGVREFQFRMRRFQRWHERWVHAANCLVADSLKRMKGPGSVAAGTVVELPSERHGVTRHQRAA
jgi:hypothetical protein